MSKENKFSIDLDDLDIAAGEENSTARGEKKRESVHAREIRKTVNASNEFKKHAEKIEDGHIKLGKQYYEILNSGEIITKKIPVSQIFSNILVRDRVITGSEKEKEEFHELVQSLKDIGLTNPIKVYQTDFDKGREKYELIQGSRRIKAARDLEWKKIDCTIENHLNDEITTYRKLIDENAIRSEVSVGEIAQLLVKKNFNDSEINQVSMSFTRGKRAWLKKCINILKNIDVKNPNILTFHRARGINEVLEEKHEEFIEIHSGITKSSHYLSEDEVLTKTIEQIKNITEPTPTNNADVDTNKSKRVITTFHKSQKMKLVIQNDKISIKTEAINFINIDDEKIRIELDSFIQNLSK